MREEPQHQRFAPLADFLDRVSRTCPHALFRDRARASQTDPHFIDSSKIIVTEKENLATRTASLVLPTVGNNYLRHESLQRFMIANDSVTVAVEIPIWLVPRGHRRASRSAMASNSLLRTPRRLPITGHIDFLQVRNNAIHILDYKPDARTNRPIAQLTIYALALSHLTGLRLFHFKCAWFNQDAYCEFWPAAIIGTGLSGTSRSSGQCARQAIRHPSCHDRTPLTDSEWRGRKAPSLRANATQTRGPHPPPVLAPFPLPKGAALRPQDATRFSKALKVLWLHRTPTAQMTQTKLRSIHTTAAEKARNPRPSGSFLCVNEPRSPRPKNTKNPRLTAGRQPSSFRKCSRATSAARSLSALDFAVGNPLKDSCHLASAQPHHHAKPKPFRGRHPHVSATQVFKEAIVVFKRIPCQKMHCLER